MMMRILLLNHRICLRVRIVASVFATIVFAVSFHCSAALAEYVESDRTFSNLGSVGKIHFKSQFYGYNSAINRPTTGGQPAYDYSVHIIKTGEDTGKRLRMFSMGRWLDATGDGDHILQHSSQYGEPYTWSMWSEAPDVSPGFEVGGAGTWWAGNVGDPEVFFASDKWLMYVQTQIDPGMPVDTGETALTQCDRIRLLTSTDCKTWTNWTTQRGVIINITNPASTNIHHQEMMYVPWDSDGKPYWMYICVNINNVFMGVYRIRSNDPYTFDWNMKETGIGFADIGNQVGYSQEAPGGPLFVRITFTADGNGRTVPSMQFSRDGISWTSGNEGAVKLDGSKDNINNKNCFFLGLSTINGTGQLEYLGNYSWRATYGATTCNTPVAPEIFNSEIGIGELIFSIEDVVAPTGSIVINSGNPAYANTGAVTLQLSAVDEQSAVIYMRFSDDNTNWSGWNPYASSMSWTLASGDGTKTVYAQFKDGAGNISSSCSDSIILDATTPTGSITINSGEASTNSTQVTLALLASDPGSGISQMRFANEGADWSAWQAYAQTCIWTLTSGTGNKVVLAQFMDSIGNISQSYSDSITLVVNSNQSKLSVIGLLVKVWGHVVFVAQDGSYLIIDDGSNAFTRIELSKQINPMTSIPSIGQYVAVTGIACRCGDSGSEAGVRPRADDDIQIISE